MSGVLRTPLIAIVIAIVTPNADITRMTRITLRSATA
jgi:hypothetical protein